MVTLNTPCGRSMPPQLEVKDIKAPKGAATKEIKHFTDNELDW
jgi:hypothetical protein